jgi:hypothetical protein
MLRTPYQSPVNTAQILALHVAVSHEALLDALACLHVVSVCKPQVQIFRQGCNNPALALKPEFNAALVHHSDEAKAARLHSVAYASMIAQRHQFATLVQCVVFHGIFRK